MTVLSSGITPKNVQFPSPTDLKYLALPCVYNDYHVVCTTATIVSTPDLRLNIYEVHLIYSLVR